MFVIRDTMKDYMDGKKARQWGRCFDNRKPIAWQCGWRATDEALARMVRVTA